MNKMSENLENVETPFLPILISNWILGIGELEYPLGRVRRVLSSIYTIALMTIYGYSAVVAYPQPYSRRSRRRPRSEIISLACNILITFSILVLGKFQRKGLKKCFKEAFSASRSLQRIGISKTHSEIFKEEVAKFLIFFIIALIVAVLNVFFTLIQWHEGGEEFLWIIFNQTFPLAMICVVDSSFMSILGYAHFKFGVLNEALEALLTKSPDTPLFKEVAQQVVLGKFRRVGGRFQVSNKDYTFVIKNAKMAHLQLVKLCQSANATYGLCILFSIIAAFVSMIDCLLNICGYISLTLPTWDMIGEVMKNVNFCLYFGIKIIIIGYFCTSLSKSSGRTGTLICKLHDKMSVNEDTQAEIQFFNAQVVQTRLEFTACGIVPIDLTLMQIMISTVVTYVVICMQFQDSDG